MREMLKTIKTRLEQGEDLVLVTITASSGSVPRGAGARMLIGWQGRICGTIGGGGVESRSEEIAMTVLREKSSRGQDFSLTQNDIRNLGMICGGQCSIFFHYIPAGDPSIIALAEEAEAFFRRGENLWLVCDLGADGALRLTDKRDAAMAPYLVRKPRRTQIGEQDLYIEQIGFSGRVYIFGGGHVAQELVPVLSRVGFRCTVMEDREEFTRPELFPTAESIILGDFRRISDYISVGSEDYVCIMTRGHAYDTLIQAQVLKCRPCYCGVIGSRRKAAGVRKALKEDFGLSEEALDLVTTPIGLSIEAETPAEIAISIAAQLILHRARQGSL